MFLSGSGRSISKGENGEFKKLNKRASVATVTTVTEHESGDQSRSLGNASKTLKVLTKKATCYFLAFCPGVFG